MAFGESVPTVQVVSRKGRKRMEIINEADFDPKKDQLWEEYQKEQAESEEEGDEAPARRPARPSGTMVPRPPGSPDADDDGPHHAAHPEGSSTQRPHAGSEPFPRPTSTQAPLNSPTLKGATTGSEEIMKKGADPAAVAKGAPPATPDKDKK